MSGMYCLHTCKQDMTQPISEDEKQSTISCLQVCKVCGLILPISQKRSPEKAKQLERDMHAAESDSSDEVRVCLIPHTCNKSWSLHLALMHW